MDKIKKMLELEPGYADKPPTMGGQEQKHFSCLLSLAEGETL